MRKIEIQDGLLVDMDKIEAIKKNTETTCKVYIGTRVYISTLPYENLKQIIEIQNVASKNTPQDEKTAKILSKFDKILGTAQFWAG